MKTKTPGSYAADMAWVKARLEEGDRVMAVRRADNGVVLRFLAFVAASEAEVQGATEFEGVPVADLRVHALFLEDGKPRFDYESRWPGPITAQG